MSAPFVHQGVTYPTIGRFVTLPYAVHVNPPMQGSNSNFTIHVGSSGVFGYQLVIGKVKVVPLGSCPAQGPKCE